MMVAHRPFIFDQDGSLLDPGLIDNWHYYINGYEYQMTELKILVEKIRSNYSAESQPVIIIQADHGARNTGSRTHPENLLEDYPAENMFKILNLLYLPGFKYDTLQPDMDPINTFPVIFNLYFNSGLPLVEQ